MCCLYSKVCHLDKFLCWDQYTHAQQTRTCTHAQKRIPKLSLGVVSSKGRVLIHVERLYELKGGRHE